ncbi:hypothetical protein CYY_009353 [Polysphondylium violaceum]|uniref:Uncharacterized protein n=1 Tax=Polysphondylium violaceum TaxID=133409 RepID=A0A8J4PK61_9MYCE|nr:hypothetical protein CYY_009353 [Polysphondylium violaceum]
MFIFLSLKKIGHFLDQDIQFFSHISTQKLSIINQLISFLPPFLLKFSQLQNMFMNPHRPDCDFKLFVNGVSHLNNKLNGLGQGAIDILIKSFIFIGPEIINPLISLAKEDTTDSDLTKIIEILFHMKYNSELSDDQIQTYINYTNHLLDRNIDGYEDKLSTVLVVLSGEHLKQFNNDEIQNIINQSKQLINQSMSDYEISSIISTITKYQYHNQIQNIINFTLQLFNQKMNGKDISKIITTISNLITKYQFSNEQIQSIINHTKQLSNGNNHIINLEELLSIISTLSNLITKYQLNNDQIQNIVNYTKQLISPVAQFFKNGYTIAVSLVILKLSKGITKFKFNFDQIQYIINYSKEFIDKRENISLHFNIIFLIIKYPLNFDQIQNILNYTKQLTDPPSGLIISTLSEQITKYQFNNDQIQTVINYTKQLIHFETMTENHISSLISTLSKQISDNQLNNDQIQVIINNTKKLRHSCLQLECSTLPSLLSKQMLEYQFNNDKNGIIIKYTTQFINENMKDSYEFLLIKSTLLKQMTEYKFDNDQIQNFINLTKQLINQNMDIYEISSIISTLSEQQTLYQLKNDQIQNIIDYTNQLNNQIMIGNQKPKIIQALSYQIGNHGYNQCQIKNIIDNTKQLINEKISGVDISSIISTISDLITKNQLNNDQIQNIINHTNQLINGNNQNMEELLSIISNLSKLIIELNFNNDQFQISINHTKQLINEGMSGYEISSNTLNLSREMHEYRFHNDQIQNIINYTKQLIHQNMDVQEICGTFRTLSYQIFRFQLNNDQIQNIINVAKQVINQNTNDKLIIRMKLSQIISLITELSIQIFQDQFHFKESSKNDIVLNFCFHLDFLSSFVYISSLYNNNPLAFEQSYISFLSFYLTRDSVTFLNLLEMMITCNSELRNYVVAKMTEENWKWGDFDTQTLCLKNYPELQSIKDFPPTINDRITIPDLKKEDLNVQSCDFDILCRQFSFHPKLFKKSVFVSFKKIQNYLNDQHDFQFLIFQSLFPYDDDQLELVCGIIGKLHHLNQEYFCCNHHISNNIQRLYYYDFKFKNIGGVNNNFLQLLDSHLSDIDNNSKPEWMKTVLLNTFNPKIKFNGNI